MDLNYCGMNQNSSCMQVILACELCWNHWCHLCDVPGMRTVTSTNCSNQVPQRSRCGGGPQAPMIQCCLREYLYRRTILLLLVSRLLRGLTRSWRVALRSPNRRLSSHSLHKRYWRQPSSPPTVTALRPLHNACVAGDGRLSFLAIKLLFWGHGTRRSKFLR
jgi:hypothetical protein